MFDCSAPFTVFDYLRVPHRVTGGPGATGGLERASGGAAASLYSPSEQLLAQAAPPGRFHLVRDVPFVGRVLPDRELQTLARQLPGSWARGEAVRDDAGGGSGAIWRSNDGSALLPFDPNEVLTAYWTERYVELGPAARRARAATLARDAYYRARP